MKVLADTHSLVWALSDPRALSTKSLKVLTEAEVTASVASLWELLLKKRRKGALLADPLAWWEEFVIGANVPTLAIRTVHVLALGRLPEIHKDPFDRILVAQAIAERMPLVSKDSHLAGYGISIIW